MRVSSPAGDTEAFSALGRVTVLGGGILPAREFYATYRPLPDRRDGERRQTWERRRVQGAGRRHKVSRRRLDHLTPAEKDALVYGIEAVRIVEAT